MKDVLKSDSLGGEKKSSCCCEFHPVSPSVAMVSWDYLENVKKLSGNQEKLLKPAGSHRAGVSGATRHSIQKRGLKTAQVDSARRAAELEGGFLLFSTWLINGDIMFFTCGHRNGRCDLLPFD